MWHYTSVHIFTNYELIFKILSLSHSAENLQQYDYYIFHHIINASLHYLVKYKYKMLTTNKHFGE